MGMYTEFYFRANVKDGPVADWLDSYINGDTETPYDDSEFFRDQYWIMVFRGGGAVYQESRTPIFHRKQASYDRTRIALASSMKHSVFIDRFIEWITPHLDHVEGEFLGYSLYEDSRPIECSWGGRGDDPKPDREQPTLYFYKFPEVRA